MPSRKPRTSLLYTYWRVDPAGQSKMWDSPLADDDVAIEKARALDDKYGGKFPCIRVERTETKTIWERKKK